MSGKLAIGSKHSNSAFLADPEFIDSSKSFSFVCLKMFVYNVGWNLVAAADVVVVVVADVAVVADVVVKHNKQTLVELK